MHSAVLQNKKYIQFAEKNTVEVISLGRLQQGIDNEDRKAATYTEKLPDGSEIEYLVKYPGMTVDDMIALNRSRASSYNNTGKIPYTAIVDPHTLERMHFWSGGQSANTIMEEVTAARRELMKEHGAGISRADLQLVDSSESEVSGLLAEDEFKKALRVVEKLSKKSGDWPQELQGRVGSLQSSIHDAAKARIKALEAEAAEDPSGAKRALRKLASDLRGTDLEAEVERLMESLG